MDWLKFCQSTKLFVLDLFSWFTSRKGKEKKKLLLMVKFCLPKHNVFGE